MIELYQGENKTIIVNTNIDLTAATEIEFRIDTPSQITKSLSDATIERVTTTKFEVLIVPGDTSSVPAGEYKAQTRYTDASGNIYNGRFRPNRVKIYDSIFVSQGSGNDYG